MEYIDAVMAIVMTALLIEILKQIWKKIRPAPGKMRSCDVSENPTGDFHGVVGNTGLSKRDCPTNIQPAGPLRLAATTTSFERTGQPCS